MTLSIVGGPLDQRIHAVLDAKRVRGPVSVAGRVAFAAGALTLVLACSAVEVRAEPAPNGAWDHLAMAFDGIFGTSHGGHGWSSRAMDLHENGKHAEAIECWQKAIAEGHSAGFEAMRARRGEDESSVEARNRRFAASPTSGNAAYNVACALALDGRTAEALQALERSVEIGYSDADHAADDSDLASLRSDAKFQELLEQMRAVELPSRFSLFGHEMGVNEAEWKDARDRHQGYVARHPKSGHAWSNLGYIHLGLDAPDAALSAYEHAQALGYAPGQTAYNLACCHARAGQVDAAFASLERAAAAGFDMGNYLASDDDLDSLRDDARFAKFQRAHPSTMRGLHDRIRGHVTRAIAL